MPVYAYACTVCSSAFDARQSFDEPALTVCEACGGALRKQYGSVGVTFKGSGFYRTDSRAAAKSGSGANASATASSSTKTSGDSSAAKPSSGPQPAAKTSTASSGGAGTVA